MKSLPIILCVTVTYLTFVSAEITIENSEFCKICNCSSVDKTASCHGKELKQNINGSSFWRDEAANASYPFFKVSVRNSGISRVFLFPESPVQILDLSRNRIQVIDKGCFKNLQNMSELDLTDNDMTSELLDPDVFSGVYAPSEYQPLKSMKILRLANNELHTLHQDLFEHIMNLEILDLHGNPLRYIDTQTLIAISGLRNLKNLDLSYTYLKKLPDHIFHTPRSLIQLNLSGNLFTKVPTFQLSEAKNLKFLSLNENPIGNITETDGFPKLENLKILHMCYMSNLSRIEDGSMSGLWNVKELYISNNPMLYYIGKKALRHTEDGAETETWPLVTKLYLDHNKLTHLDHEFLARWDALDEVDITYNAWTCECENQWLINTLVKFAIKKNEHHKHGLWCAAPLEMEGKTLEDIYNNNETLRCLDLYGAMPEKDAGVLIGILIGLLTGIPLALGVLFCYKKQFFGLFTTGPAAFSRKFYNAAANEEEFYG